MRRSIRWALALTLVATTGAALLPAGRPGDGVVAARDVARAKEPLAPAPQRMANAAQPLPAELPEWRIEAAEGDPFFHPPPQPVAATAPAAKATPAASPSPAPPVAVSATPAPPPIPPRYLGRLLTPAGEALVFLAGGDAVFVARPGAAVGEGFVVQAVGAESLKLAHVASGTQVDIPLPPGVEASSVKDTRP